MDLANAPQRLVEFRLSGYETATRLLHMRDMTHLVFWREASGDLKTWNFPLWLGSEDFFIPRKTLTGESPARVHVHLRRQADQ